MTMGKSITAATVVLLVITISSVSFMSFMSMVSPTYITKYNIVNVFAERLWLQSQVPHCK